MAIAKVTVPSSARIIVDVNSGTVGVEVTAEGVDVMLDIVGVVVGVDVGTDEVGTGKTRLPLLIKDNDQRCLGL